MIGFPLHGIALQSGVEQFMAARTRPTLSEDPAASHEQPVGMDRGVPVEATIEDWMDLRRRHEVIGAVDDPGQVVRIRTGNACEGEFGTPMVQWFPRGRRVCGFLFRLAWAIRHRAVPVRW